MTERCRVVVGAQWGDEGKGKIVDVLAAHVSVIARYQGGANAGHTVHVGDEEFVLHQIPSGILYDDTRCLLGNGVVFDIEQFFQELDGLHERGIHAEAQIGISGRAHLLLDLYWYWDILIPCFVEATGWPADHRRRFLVHNTLLTYLDSQARESLPADAAGTLAAVRPNGWLPFAGDGNLIQWRDMLVEQLLPGAVPATVSIYAERMRMSPQEFAANLEDPGWMAEEVFRKVSLEHVLGVIDRGINDSVGLVTEYLSGREP